MRKSGNKQEGKATTSVDHDTIAANQCRDCFDSIEASLSKHLLSWSDVRKLTVFLVTGECDVNTVRVVREEYPFPKDHAITTFLYVQRLEIEHSVVQMEVIAASSSSSSLLSTTML
jgi:enamine deaminase RidA (YjgF/YER057c/UK114 family)